MSHYESSHSCTDLNLEVAHFTEDVTHVIIPYFLGNDLNALKKCPNLESLEISIARSEDRIDNPALDISAILELSKLKKLRIHNCHLTDYTILEKMTQLEWLWIVELRTHNLDFLANYKNLRTLGIAYSDINDISNLKQLKDLTYLRLSHNKISSIEPLSDLTNLKCLFLDDNKISDFSPIYGLTKNIDDLGLEDNLSTEFNKIPYVNEIEDTDFDLDDCNEDDHE